MDLKPDVLLTRFLNGCQRKAEHAGLVVNDESGERRYGWSFGCRMHGKGHKGETEASLPPNVATEKMQQRRFFRHELEEVLAPLDSNEIP